MNFLTSVEVRDELLKGMPVQKLQSRPVHAIILSFYGYQPQVCHMLQRLCHTSRAFIINSGGLAGFLVKFDLIDLLREEERRGNFEKITGMQNFTIDDLESELSQLSTSK